MAQRDNKPSNADLMTTANVLLHYALEFSDLDNREMSDTCEFLSNWIKKDVDAEFFMQ